MGGWIIYHPKRQVSKFGNLIIYHDTTSHNQDPYIWNDRFLHTACHITQMSPEIGDINFWVSGDTFPKFRQLYCDLVFVVKKKVFWREPNSIRRSDSMVESDEAFNDHYSQFPIDHPYRKRARFTLKASRSMSFQPQDRDGQLIDILPYLQILGLSAGEVRKKLYAGINSRPMPLSNDLADKLYQFLKTSAPIQLKGSELQRVRRAHPESASAKLKKKM